MQHGTGDSFVGVLEAYGAEHPPLMRPVDFSDVRTWQTRFVQKVRDLMGPVPDRVECRPTVTESISEDGYTRHVLRVPVTPIDSPTVAKADTVSKRADRK